MSSTGGWLGTYTNELHAALDEQLLDADLNMDPEEFKYQYRKGWDLCLKVGPDCLVCHLWQAWLHLHHSAWRHSVPYGSWHLVCKMTMGIFKHVNDMIHKGYAKSTPETQLEVTCVPLEDLFEAFKYFMHKGPRHRRLRGAWAALRAARSAGGKRTRAQ